MSHKLNSKKTKFHRLPLSTLSYHHIWVQSYDLIISLLMIFSYTNETCWNTANVFKSRKSHLFFVQYLLFL